MAADPPHPIYSIGAVARMLDIPASTLRTWEERYAIVVPKRSPSGQRVYTRAQVEQLRFVAGELQAGLQPADAHRLLAERIRERGALVFEPERDAPRLHVLLAERDPFAAQLTEFFLKTEGFEVATLLTLADAEEHLADAEPGLWIVELLLGGGGGLALCRRVKSESDAPVLAISTLDDADRALAAGADAFLQKPLDPLGLVATVKDLLGRSALVRDYAGSR